VARQGSQPIQEDALRVTKAERQAFIDAYLQETGENLFVPGDFVDWLRGKPDHPLFPSFYGQDDAEAAREHRVWLARRMANGLRIVAKVSVAPDHGQVVSVKVREFPAYLSHVSLRTAGGGYQPFDPHDTGAMDELRRQGAVALRSWLSRYGGAFADYDLRVIEEIAASDRVALSA